MSARKQGREILPSLGPGGSSTKPSESVSNTWTYLTKKLEKQKRMSQNSHLHKYLVGKK